MLIHTVRRGDTLWRLGQLYQADAEHILAANGIASTDSHPLVVGQSLIIPARASSHSVAPGETLYSIAQRYGATLQELALVNHIHNPALIKKGQVLQIPQPFKPLLEVNGYTETYSYEGAALIHEVGSNLTSLSPFSYQVGMDGSLTALDDSAIIQAAYQKNITPMMVITNFDEHDTFSSELAHRVLTDAFIRKQLIANLLMIMRTKGYIILHVDFEYIYPAERELYNQFLQQLVDTMHHHSFLVSSALAPKLADDQRGAHNEGLDYAAHGRIVDFVILMTYEWGWPGGAPLAIAPLNEVVKVLDYALSVMPASKIVMGMPMYGYDWTLPSGVGGWAATVSPQEAVQRAAVYGAEIHYDSQAQSPYYSYYDEQGREHVVWYEDARSVQAKCNIAKFYKLRGISYWVLGLPFPQNWYVLRENFHIKKLI